MPQHRALEQWVDQVARATRPDRIQWCDGSEEEHQILVEGMLRDGTLIDLNHQRYPGCFLHRSHPSDVARTEHLTFICTSHKDDAGPTNNWMAPAEARAQVGKLFEGSMKGRTMYVIPYLMGPAGSPYSRVGVEITDSAYVVVNMRLMTRMGKIALERLGESDSFVRGLHSLGDLNPDRRFILHFPEERLIWSIGSGYGGNALLGKKCHALRIASWIGRDEGWLAEHTLIIGVEDPSGRVTYMAAAFPSACGKTNLAMLVPPADCAGYKVWTVGDDIAWMHVGEDGRLWAVNPEAGFFGVAPGTNAKTNPNMMAAIGHRTIFTNVAVTPDGEPWWEGKGQTPPDGLTDWRGNRWTSGEGPAAHPNSRFTTAARQCPSISPHWENPEGVPISAILFGGRRARVAPLVYQSYGWQHGVFVGAGMASETTAAQSGAVGVTRRDPMAMVPFCGYHMADYFTHWLDMGQRIAQPPAIFHVNWFRTDNNGRFLWPGFGENIRVLKWILERVDGQGQAVESPIGFIPAPNALDLEGLRLPDGAVDELLRIDADAWAAEQAEQGLFFDRLNPRLPAQIRDEHTMLRQRLSRLNVAVQTAEPPHTP
ncbi:MAG: phosphoenolpyruvate carboxykinase (GTP) [Candidatus Methylomirabilota bacterium]|nr:MAG: phosphoenolpyruvate carboxykinase (GTP) [candidate division NC10 bacterium]